MSFRGADHLNNACKTIADHRADGVGLVPVYAHVAADPWAGRRQAFPSGHGALASRGPIATWVYLPETMRNYLLRLGWKPWPDDETISTEAGNPMVSTWRGIGKSPGADGFSKKLDNPKRPLHPARSGGPHTDRRGPSPCWSGQTPPANLKIRWRAARANMTKAMPGLKERGQDNRRACGQRRSSCSPERGAGGRWMRRRRKLLAAGRAGVALGKVAAGAGGDGTGAGRRWKRLAREFAEGHGPQARPGGATAAGRDHRQGVGRRPLFEADGGCWGGMKSLVRLRAFCQLTSFPQQAIISSSPAPCGRTPFSFCATRKMGLPGHSPGK